MIEKIEIRNEASYDTEGVVLDNIKEINFIYGSNGSGKTTISRVIRNQEKFRNCRLTWRNGSPYKTLVYNKDFVEENFHQSEEIKGIFTLGKESHETLEEIASLKLEIDKNDKEITNIEQTLVQKKSENDKNYTEYESNCWKIKIKYDNVFVEAFQGFRNSKARFTEKCKTESLNNTSSLLSYEELTSLSKSIFGGVKDKYVLVDKLDTMSLGTIENDPILTTKIIGKDDVAIADLIKRLNISDWVKVGQKHLELTDNICPFCQRPTSEEFRAQLEEYFNETYNKQIKLLVDFRAEYIQKMETIIFQIDKLTKINNEFFDNNFIEQQYKIILTKFQKNLNIIDKKVIEPSIPIQIDSLIIDLNVVKETIEISNQKIQKHNNMIDNIIEEKKNLISRIWCFVANEIKSEFELYNSNNTKLEKALTGINKSIIDKKERKKVLNLKISELEGKITSTIPTVKEINKLLKSFGFVNFKFTAAKEAGYYKVIRENGENAQETLSEGEKTFITFLYFYQLIFGSTDKDNITINKIVIFDDPISSLDSNVLFIVSNLIRGIIENIKALKGYVKQIFVLTHNVYFHKEVSFDKKRSGSNKMSNETFWILRKKDKVSQIDSYDHNPIKTSYELLWQELRNCTERSSITTQNVMRRIIENYFKILGHESDDDLINKFDSEERVICRSLMSWVNDGSHYVPDDLYVDSSPDIIEKYLIVFEKIFVLTGHDGHYRMMMGDKTTNNLTPNVLHLAKVSSSI